MGALALLALGGCKNVEGRWLGECGFEDPVYAYVGLVDLRVNDGKGTNVEATVAFDMSDGRHFEGPLEGVRSDTYIELEGVLTEDGYGPYTFSMSGEVQDYETIDGDCGFRIPNGTGMLQGDLLLER